MIGRLPAYSSRYAATNLANELYNSTQAGSRDTLDYAAKFSDPTRGERKGIRRRPDTAYCVRAAAISILRRPRSGAMIIGWEQMAQRRVRLGANPVDQSICQRPMERRGQVCLHL